MFRDQIKHSYSCLIDYFEVYGYQDVTPVLVFNS